GVEPLAFATAPAFSTTEVNRGAFAASAASGGARHSSCGPSAPLLFLLWQSGDPRIHEMKCRMSGVVHGWARTLLVAAAAAVMLMPCTCEAQHRENIWTSKSESIDPRFLPLGNHKYSDGPKVGYIYPCEPRKHFSLRLGARRAGEWIHESTWDATRKPAVRGEVFWKDAKFSITIVGDRRIFTGNGLPVDVPTGIFPIGKDDPAFRYDQNPNSIKVHDVSFSLPTNPTMAEAPSCIRPPVGIALDGVRFSSALDSLARDE